MAGHSKWANIRHRKSAQDARRGAVFTKLAKEIMVAARMGGSDENMNARLRTAVLKARAANMPKDNIERAVKKGAGELDGMTFEDIVYEGYGPGGVAVIVEVMTDKRSRTLPEIKNLFTKSGGSLAENGAVSYLFEHIGVLIIEAEGINEDDLIEPAIEAGADDLESEPGMVIVKCARENFHSLISALEPFVRDRGWRIAEAGLKFMPISLVEIAETHEAAVEKLLSALEEHDDVQNVYSNANLAG